MEIKKSPKADLESKKSTFILIGLVVSLFVIWRVFEYKSYDKQVVDDLTNHINKLSDDPDDQFVKEELMRVIEQFNSQKSIIQRLDDQAIRFQCKQEVPRCYVPVQWPLLTAGTRQLVHG